MCVCVCVRACVLGERQKKGFFVPPATTCQGDESRVERGREHLLSLSDVASLYHTHTHTHLPLDMHEHTLSLSLSLTHTHTHLTAVPLRSETDSHKSRQSPVCRKKEKNHTATKLLQFCWNWRYDVACHRCIVGNRTDALSSPVMLYEKNKNKTKNHRPPMLAELGRKALIQIHPCYFLHFPECCATHTRA